MHKAISAVLVVALAVAAVPAAKHAPAPKPKPTPTATALPLTAPPIIARTVSRPFCSALRNTIKPAIGALLANDKIIARAPAMLAAYNRANGDGDLGNPERELQMVKMGNLVRPIVENIAAIQKALAGAVFHDPPRNADDKRLLDLRAELQQIVAEHSASLDIVNGFVQTQELSDMQHEGIDDPAQASINKPDTTVKSGAPTPLPDTVDPKQAGIQQDTQFINPDTMPGTSTDNQVTGLAGSLEQTRSETQRRETVAAKKVFEAVNLCSGRPINAAQPTPSVTSRP